jgi:glycosyltransferase involved in cell wall biosynthesis
MNRHVMNPRRAVPEASSTAFSPIRVCEVELSGRLPAIEGHRTARVLARWYREPLALIDVPLTDGVASAGELAAALWPAARPLVARRFAAAGEPAPAALPVTGIQLAGPPPYLRGLAQTLATAPPASVIVCTRDRAERLASCLAAVVAQGYPDFEVIVVDNAPAGDQVADLIAARSWPVPVRRIVEPRPGLAWARNTGLRAASGRVVAYLDDDERPDRDWLAELVRGFTLAPDVAGVSGIVLPATLDTPAQCLFERFGGHSKGRGFTAAIFDAASHATQHPLYPLPPFGVGASMAFDRDRLLRAGGFDVALGAGTPARAGEDTAAISDLMLGGATFVYWPGAVMWHEHRAELAEMERQLFGYGSGLTAFYLRALLRDPARLAAMARLAPLALRDLRGRDSVRTATMGEDYPPALRRAMRRGLVAGPGLYLRSRLTQARLSRTGPTQDSGGRS